MLVNGSLVWSFVAAPTEGDWNWSADHCRGPTAQLVSPTRYWVSALGRGLIAGAPQEVDIRLAGTYGVFCGPAYRCRAPLCASPMGHFSVVV